MGGGLGVLPAVLAGSPVVIGAVDLEPPEQPVASAEDARKVASASHVKSRMHTSM
jgi:hypothetical protein